MISHKRKKHRYLNKELEIEDIFLDAFLKRQKKKGGVGERKLELPLKKAAFFTFSLLTVAALVLFWAVSFDLQTRKHEDYTALAQANKYITLKILAERGVIFDRDMTPLVSNEIRYDLLIDKTELPSDEQAREQVLNKTAEILGEEMEDLNNQIEQSKQDLLTAAKDLSHQALVLIESNLSQLNGVKLKKHTQRKYTQAEGLSHILGYMGKISAEDLKSLDIEFELADWVGKEGLEKQYEELLKESKGITEIERNVQGEIISQNVRREPSSGKNLVLNIDLALQQKLAGSLARVMEEVGSQSGVAVAMNPANGEVLASVSLPFFDNNLFAQGISQEDFEALNEDPANPQLNRAIAGLYPVGSTIKPIIGLAALEEGIIDEETTLYCPEELCLEHRYTKEKECFPDWEFHGYTDIKKAIAQSVNPFFYMIGGGYLRPNFADTRLPRIFDGLGVENIKKYLELFGWGRETGIDLPGENKGRVPSPEWKEEYFDIPVQQKWYLGDTYNLSIGQGYLLATPLQVATAFAAIANKGTLFQPRLLKTIADPRTREQDETEALIQREDFLSEESLAVVREGMRNAVASGNGSAAMLSSLPVKAAAKTGTAQVSQDEIYHNWVAVFAPYDEPEIVLTILIERVEGTRIAAQKVAYQALSWYFSR